MHLFLQTSHVMPTFTGADVSCARVCGVGSFRVGKPQKVSPKKSVTSSEPEQGSFVFPNGEKYGECAAYAVRGTLVLTTALL